MISILSNGGLALEKEFFVSFWWQYQTDILDIGEKNESGREAVGNHRIIGWKRPLRSLSPTINWTPPCLLNHSLKRHIHMFFEHLQGWGLLPLPGQPIPMSDHSFSKEIFPNIQSKPPLMQPEAIASSPIPYCLGEETNTCLATISFRVVVESNKVSSHPPLLQDEEYLKGSLFPFGDIYPGPENKVSPFVK